MKTIKLGIYQSSQVWSINPFYIYAMAPGRDEDTTYIYVIHQDKPIYVQGTPDSIQAQIDAVYKN